MLFKYSNALLVSDLLYVSKDDNVCKTVANCRHRQSWQKLSS